MPKIEEVKIAPAVVIQLMLDLEREGVEEIAIEDLITAIRRLEKTALEQINEQQQ